MKIIPILILLCPAFALRAQERKIGDQIPDITIQNVSNYKTGTINFRDLQGQLVILDFWGLNCAPCLRALPKLEELQKKYNSRLQVLLVNNATKNWIDSVVKWRKHTMPKFQFTNLPSITEDSLLNQIFPHNSIPHYVWINQNGRVVAITGSEDITESAIKKLLNHEEVALPVKKKFLNLKYDEALLPQIDSFFPKKLQYYSMLLHNIPDLAGASIPFFVDSSQGTIRISRVNQSILEFYMDALTFSRSINPFGSPDFSYGKRVVLNCKDSTKYFFRNQEDPGMKQWAKTNTYCYETVLPLQSQQNAYRNFLQDLNQFFGLEGKIQKKKMLCMILVRKSKKNKIPLPTIPPYQLAVYTDSLGTFNIHGAWLISLTDELSRQNQDKPYVFLDETHFQQRCEMQIHSSLRDLKTLRKELRKKFDLDLVLKNRKVDVLILSEINKDN